MFEPAALHPGTLRAYDIRGVVGDTLTEHQACAVGRAFATIVSRRVGRCSIGVGYDGRLTSPKLEEALVAGLEASGADVARIGLGPTPMLYFAGKTLPTDGAVMVTGSHNPPDHNGFKMMLSGSAFYGDDIQELGRIAAAGEFSDGVGSSRNVDVSDDYVTTLLDAYRSKRPLKVAWDAGNGAAGDIMRRLSEKMPGEHILLCADIDGTFPNHHPDPTVPENLALLIETVREHACDLGVAFDGDGDRLGAVDGTGRILWGDQILCLLASDLLRDQPGATVIADVKASQVLFDYVADCGGQPLMWRTGHSPIKSKMAETGAPLAGEMSGHIFFADRYFGFDDGLYAAVRLLDVIGGSGQSAAALRDALPQRINTPELRFPCDDTRKFDVVVEVADRLKQADANVIDIDGVRVNTDDGWWLLRASNTQPVLVARCEAKDEVGLERLKSALSAQLNASGVAPPDDL